jgi:transcriptional regulator with XRE-family HTH domain
MGTQDWEYLGRTVRTRRLLLGLSQADVIAAGGPSDQTLRELERGESGIYRVRTMAALERVLKWAPGAIEAILKGGQPAAYEIDEPKAALVSDWVPEVTSAGQGFLHLLEKHCAADPDAAAIRQTVLPFIKKINEGGG